MHRRHWPFTYPDTVQNTCGRALPASHSLLRLFGGCKNGYGHVRLGVTELAEVSASRVKKLLGDIRQRRVSALDINTADRHQQHKVASALESVGFSFLPRIDKRNELAHRFVREDLLSK